MSTPIVGIDAKVTITKGADPTVTLLNSKWSLGRENKVGEAHNTTDKTRRVRGRSDATGSVEGFQDMTDEDTSIDNQIEDGDTVTIKLYTNETQFYSGSVIVKKLHIDTGVDDVFAWNFDFELALGTITPPVYA